jgi:hypothetical protein
VIGFSAGTGTAGNCAASGVLAASAKKKNASRRPWSMAAF